MSENPSIKVVVVGDGAVGKTCLLVSYTTDTFPQTYEPTVFNNSTKDVTLLMDPKDPESEVDVGLELWDTAGQEEYERIRYLSYRDTKIFLLCFSLTEQTSFANIKAVWIPEVKYHAPDTILMLVGTKEDLVDSEEKRKALADKGKNPVDPALAEKFANENGMHFISVSAKTRKNVTGVFEKAIRVFLSSGGDNKRAEQKDGGCGCTVL